MSPHSLTLGEGKIKQKTSKIKKISHEFQGKNFKQPECEFQDGIAYCELCLNTTTTGEVLDKNKL